MSLTLFSILCLGFFLGMRHASDPDHVIAVSTIVSRQRSIGAAALTGICWGAGHGLTMLIVGGAIVLFGFVVPERLGLSLELGVALMLIVLGVLNVSGTVRRGSRDSGGRRPWSRARHLPRLAGNAFWRVVPVSSRPRDGDWRRAWAGWIGGSDAARAPDYSRSAFVNGLFGDLRSRHHCGDDADYSARRAALSIHASTPAPASSLDGCDHGNAQR